jgi:hypothetical protein
MAPRLTWLSAALGSGSVFARRLSPQQPGANYGAIRSAELQGCGEVCEDIAGTPGTYFPVVRKAVDCPAIFANAAVDAAAQVWPPPRQVPATFTQDYTMGGKVQIEDWYFARKQADGAMTMTWTAPQLQELEAQLRAGTAPGSYGAEKTVTMRNFLATHADSIRGRHCVVLGSQRPWLEVLLLMNGAAHVTTIEYATIVSQDTRVSTMTPDKWKSGDQQYDCVASFSSVEHSGLGRYGDELNPFGDLQVMAKLGCSAKPGASFFIGVPYGRDSVVWNAHRIYGPVRAPQLFANLDVHDRLDVPFNSDFSQSLFYATKL